MARTLSVTDALNGHYLTSTIAALVRADLFEAIAGGQSVSDLARRQGVDPQLVLRLASYIEATSDILEREADSLDRFRLGTSYADLSEILHLLDLYHGAFGECAARLDLALADPSEGGRWVNWERHAAALARAATPDMELLSFIRQLSPKCVLDIGCGTGMLLAALSRLDPDFEGIGIDENEAAIRQGQAMARLDRRLEKAITLRTCSATQVLQAVGPAPLQRVQLVVAASVMNSFFADEAGTAAISLLRSLKTALPERLMVIGDYFGRLNKPPFAYERHARTYLHDFAQIVSGQGIPPASMAPWEDIYGAAGVTLIRAFDMAGAGIDRLIHLIQL